MTGAHDIDIKAATKAHTKQQGRYRQSRRQREDSRVHCFIFHMPIYAYRLVAVKYRVADISSRLPFER